MKLAAEQEWEFTAAEITRVGQEISATFGGVCYPVSKLPGTIKARVLIEIEHVEGR